MEVLFLNSRNSAQCAARAADVLRAGGVVLYPTDTLYGLGADAFSGVAVEKLYAIKAREKGKVMHCVVADLAAAARYAVPDERAEQLARKLLPGPLTLILKKKPNVVTGIGKDIDTLGIRIPNNDFCLALARSFGAPYTTTSANISGAPTARRISEILSQLGPTAGHMIDLVIDAGELPESLPSTVVDLSGDEPVILREGAISAKDIRTALA